MLEQKTEILSIIIVNYNGKNFLKACIDSIDNYLQSIRYEVVIIDNNSTDDSVSFLKKNYPTLSLIENKRNVGFAAANNQGVRMAAGETLLLLNNDTVLMGDISEALRLLNEDDTIGAVGIKMLDGNKNYLPSFGKFPKPFNLLRISNLSYQFEEAQSGEFRSKDPRDVDWISGAFLLTKKRYWNTVGGLDEDYFMYVEDVDFCKKLQYIQLKSVFLPDPFFVHHVGFNSKREHLLIKGYSIYASKHFNTFEEKIAKLLLYINYAFKKIFKNIR